MFFFTLPVLWIVYYSFGYKPNIFHPIATDKLSLDRYREGALRHVRARLLPDAADLDHRHDRSAC